MSLSKHAAMMTLGEACAVRVIASDGRENPGQIRIQKWDKKARLKRALKFLGICWGLSLVSIIIPLAHFVLVPGFFLAGLGGVFFIYEQKDVVLGGESVCPACRAFLPIARNSLKWPLTDLCSQCRAQIKIEASN